MFLINHELKAIYIPTPKCASSYLRYILITYYGFKQYAFPFNNTYSNKFLINLIHAIKNKPLVKFYIDERISTTITIEQFYNYKKFTFLRNPYDRFISSYIFYNFTINCNEIISYLIYYYCENNNVDINKSFILEDFLNYLYIFCNSDDNVIKLNNYIIINNDNYSNYKKDKAIINKIRQNISGIHIKNQIIRKYIYDYTHSYKLIPIIDFINTKNLYTLQHNTPYSDYLTDEYGNSFINFYGHVETIQEDIIKILTTIGINNFNHSFDKTNNSYKNKETLQYYTNEILEIINNHYINDFSTFNFKKYYSISDFIF